MKVVLAVDKSGKASCLSVDEENNDVSLVEAVW